MATLIRPSKNNTYYINPAYLTFVENSGYGVQLIQVSVSSSCYISVYDSENGIRYTDASEIRKWKITAYNNKFPDGDTDSWNIYVRLEREGASALIVYDKKERAVSGGVITTTTDEEGNTVTETGDADPTYYYIKIGTVGSTDGVSVIRKIVYDTGYLETAENRNAVGDILASMFVPHYDNPENPDELSWIEAKSHMGIRGGVASFVQGEGIDLPSIYDGLEIDNQTIVWEEINGVKTLVAKVGSGDEIGGTADFSNVKESGSGNAYTSFTVAEDGTVLTLVKGITFVDKAYLDENYLTTMGISDGYHDKIYVDNNFYTKTYSDENFAKSSDFNALQTSFNDFLNGEDVDTTINKWKELEAFLSNMTESDNLATILSNKAETSALESLSKVVDTKWTQDDARILNWDTAFGWGDHSKVGYALKTYVDTTFIGIMGDYDIEGIKNFVGSLQVNGCPIVYDATNKYWKFEGDMLVTGGLATFSSDVDFTPSSVMDALLLDETTIHVNEEGRLEVIGGTGSGGGIGEEDVKILIESYGYATSSDLPTFNSSDFSVSSSGMVSLAGARVEVVSSTDSMNETGVLYVIV